MIIKKYIDNAWVAQEVKTTAGAIFTDTTFTTSIFDGSNKIKVDYLPDAAFGSMRYAGAISANTTTDALNTLADAFVAANGGVVKGLYFVSTGTYTVTLSAGDTITGGDEGASGNQTLEAGDWIILSETDGTDQTWAIVNNTYSLATASAPGVVQVGYTENGQNYPVELSSGKMFVNVPWTDNDTVYTHPTYAGDDISIDTGALTGAYVISDLDFNVTTDSLGHVTDANATVSTRQLTLANLGFTGDSNANYFTYSHPTQTAISVDTAGAEVMDILTVNTLGHVTAATKRTMTLADLGYTGATDANKYIHPTYNGDDINLDTGALTGATVISDLDFNVTTDTSGHVTDANATYSTRTLTLADLGYTAPTIGNGAFTVTSGTGLSGGGQLGTANQAGNTSLTLSVDYPVYWAADLSGVTGTAGAFGFEG